MRHFAVVEKFTDLYVCVFRVSEWIRRDMDPFSIYSRVIKFENFDSKGLQPMWVVSRKKEMVLKWMILFQNWGASPQLTWWRRYEAFRTWPISWGWMSVSTQITFIQGPCCVFHDAFGHNSGSIFIRCSKGKKPL